MSYISTELSESDLQNLNDIFNELEKINIPTVFTNEGVIPRRYHANRTGTHRLSRELLLINRLPTNSYPIIDAVANREAVV